MNKQLSVTPSPFPGTTTFAAIRSCFGLQKTEPEKFHNSNNAIKTSREHASRLLSGLELMADNNYQLMNALRVLVDKGDFETANEQLCRETGYSVSQDVELYMPRIVDNDSAAHPKNLISLLAQNYQKAVAGGYETHFLTHCLGEGGVCYQAMAMEIIGYKPPSSRLDVMSKADFSEKFPALPEDDYFSYLYTTFSNGQIEPFRTWKGISETVPDETILQSQDFIQWQSYLGFGRGFVQLLRDLAFSKDEIHTIVSGLQANEILPQNLTLHQLTQTGFERTLVALVENLLGHRIECLFRTGQDDLRGMAGLERTFDTISKGKKSVPVVLLHSQVPFEVYARTFSSAGIFIDLHNTKLIIGSKQDFGSDRLREVVDTQDFRAITDEDQKLRYIERAFGLKPGSLLGSMEEVQDKLDEIGLRRQTPQDDKASKYALPNSRIPRERLIDPDLVSEKLAELQKAERTLETLQLKAALRKLLCLTGPEQTRYLDRAFSEPGLALQKYSSATTLRHNEQLTLFDPHDITAVYVNLGLPGTYAQSLGLQDEIAKVNGGERLPLVLYSPQEVAIAEVSRETLGEIERFFLALLQNPQKMAQDIAQFIERHPQLRPIAHHIKEEAYGYVLQSLLTSGRVTECVTLATTSTQDQEDRQLIQKAFLQTLSSLTKATKTVSFLIPFLKELTPFLVTMLGPTVSHPLKLLAVTAISNISTHEEALAPFSKNPALIQALVDVLKDVSPLAKENAAWAIAHISTLAEARALFAKNPALIQALVDVLKNGSPPAKAISACAIMNIAAHADAKALFAENEALIGALVDVLKNGSPPAKEKAASAISNISTHAEAQALFSENEALIGALVDVLKNGSPPAKAISACAIMNIAAHADAQALFSENEALIGALVDVLENGSPDAKGNAAGAISNIAMNNPEAKKRLKTYPCISRLRSGQLPALGFENKPSLCTVL